MSGILSAIEPKNVFAHFEKICDMPHGSGNTAIISDYLRSWAESRGFAVVQEPCGNIIVRVPASAGCEAAPTVILQGHMDMVAVKDADCAKDMEKEGLALQTDGEYVWAKGTSLGGDDGIALAYAMAIAEADDVKHPGLELLFTIDEETGMDGALALDPALIHGRRLINLDSEEEGTLLVGCAGGARVDLCMPLEREEISGSAYRLKIAGLQGGHSGAEIHRNRENALLLMGRILGSLGAEAEYRLADLCGGTKDNVIPSEAEALIFCEASAEGSLEKIKKDLLAELISREPGLQITWEKTRETGSVVSGECRDRIIRLLTLLPFGVVKMSAAMPGVVETSANVGTITMSDEFRLTCSVRSMIASARDYLAQQIVVLAALCGCESKVHGAYPGWQYRPESPLRDTMIAVYEKMYGKKPQVEAIHAGLECGLFLEKLPDLDCVSLGPDILDIHSTKERLSIASTARMWDYLKQVLTALC